MAPGHALQDQFLLHRMVGHRALVRALDDEEAARRRMARGVADHALGGFAQLLGRDCTRQLERQKAGRHHRHEGHLAQVHPFEARVALVDAVQDQIGLAVEQALARAADGFKVQVQPRARTLRKEAAQQAQGLGARAQVADHHAQLAFLAHRQLRRVGAQLIQLAQQRLRAAVQGAPGLGGRDAVAAAVQQGQTELAFQLADRREHGRMRAMQAGCRGLEAAGLDHGVEALKVVQGESVHVSQAYSDRLIFVISSSKQRN
jgi:hypothetical protein